MILLPIRIPLITLSLLFTIALSVCAETRIERPVAPGARFTEIHRQDPSGKPWAIYVLEIDRSATNLSLHTTKAKDQVLGGEVIRSQSRRVQAPGEVIAAVNGDFYWTDRTFFGQPVGAQVRGGELLTGPYLPRPIFGISQKGEPMLGALEQTGSLQAGTASYPIALVNKSRNAGDKPDVVALYTRSYGLTTRASTPSTDVVLRDIKPALPLKAGIAYTATVGEVRKDVSDSAIPVDAVLLSGTGAGAAFLEQNLPTGATVSFSVGLNPDWSRVPEATGVWPVLVRGGKLALSDVSDQSLKVRHPRTAVGWNDRKLYFVAVDGRQAGHSVGMSLEELGALMIELGCTDAANLDGGGSTTMVVRGTVVNRPSDGIDRTVSNGWAVVNTAAPGPLAAARIWPDSPSVLAGSRIQFLLAGADAAGDPVTIAPSAIKWTANEALGAVDANGLFTAAKSPRAGQVVATVGSVTAATTINVWDTPARVLIFPGKIAVTPGGSTTLSVLALDAANRPIFVDTSAITWSVSGAGAAIDASGRLSVGQTPGTFTVTATVGGTAATAEGQVSSPSL